MRLSAGLHATWRWFFGAAAALGGGGWRGLLGWCVVRAGLPVRFAPPLFGYGTLLKRDEFLSLHENFLEGELRFPEMEAALRAAEEPLVIDVGVNLGVTVRWWFHLNPRARVIAIDMMREAHEFAAARLEAMAPTASTRVDWMECAVSDAASTIDVRFDDPLFGMNRADGSSGQQHRAIRADTLDALVGPSRAPLLVKMDIEGAAGRAFAGAAQLLQRTQFALVEYHDAAECADVTRLAAAAGLGLVRATKKTLVFARQ